MEWEIVSSEVVPALIALVGVVGSAAISYIVSSRQSSIELQKLRTSLQTELGSKLYEKRLEVYPELYAQLSNLVKLIEFGDVTSKNLKEILATIQEWDTKNSIFFSIQTGYICYNFRKMLANIVKDTDENLQKEFSLHEQKKELKQKIHELELALKHELGTLHFESPINLKELEKFASYTEARKIATQQDVPKKRKRWNNQIAE